MGIDTLAVRVRIPLLFLCVYSVLIFQLASLTIMHYYTWTMLAGLLLWKLQIKQANTDSYPEFKTEMPKPVNLCFRDLPTYMKSSPDDRLLI